MSRRQGFSKAVSNLIRFLCGDYLAEGIEGDMLENFLHQSERGSRFKARFWLYWELLLLLRFIFYRKEKTTYQNSNIMIREYFKIGYRVILRSKVYSFVNLFGLGAGMACTLLIYLWVTDELSFDRFHQNVDELYRLEFDQGEVVTRWGNPSELATAIKEQIPEVKMVSRYREGRENYILQYGDQTFHEEGYVAVDPDFFEMFSFEFLQGGPENSLADPFSIVMTESLAQKYFGNKSPLGASIKLNNQHMMTVRGVIADIPDNSTFQFDFATPMEFLKVNNEYESSWSSVWLQTYVQIDPGVDLEATGSKILESIMRGKNVRWEKEYVDALVFNPLRTMRLKQYSWTGTGFEQKNLQSIYTFSGLGLLILLIACINFMNLSTARSAKRAKEIGMRKVVGALKGNIRSQFLGESLLQTIFALVLGLMLVLLLLEPFNQLSGKDLGLADLLNPQFLAGVIMVVLLVSMVSGSYPAFYLSSFKPIKVLKGQFSAGMRSTMFRKVLVVVQFGLSIFLIIGTLVIYAQMNYVRDKDLGYEKEHVLYIPLVHDYTRQAYESLKARWLSNPQIDQVSASQVRPSSIGWSSSAEWEGKDPEDSEDIYHNRVDLDYIETLGIQLKEGRDFSADFKSDEASDGKGGFIVNETMANKMDTDGQAIGKVLRMSRSEGPVVGIMNDFHFSSLKRSIHPIALMLIPESKRFALLKLRPGDVRNTVKSVGETWTELLPDYPFEYHFLDEDFEAMYRTDEQLGNLLGTFSVLAIVIASLGLFGLASFTAEERKKEVAIRKVLGATHLKVTYLLCKDFLLLVILANLTAWPLGKWIMGGWLDAFAYRIDFGLEIFAFSGLLALAIALLTIVFQTLKAAMANPVGALKYE